MTVSNPSPISKNLLLTPKFFENLGPLDVPSSTFYPIQQEFEVKFKEIIDLLLNLKSMINDITSGSGVIQELKDKMPNLDEFIQQFEDGEIQASDFLS